jgi:hypothetical protein
MSPKKQHFVRVMLLKRFARPDERGRRFVSCSGRSTSTEVSIVRSSYIYLRQLVSLGCMRPFALLVSLVGMKVASYSFAGPGSIFEDEAGTLDRDQFHFTEVILDDVPADPYEYAKLLRPLLDQIANAAGRDSTPSFDATGRYRNKVD